MSLAQAAFVVLCNGLLAGLCFCLALRVWRLRCALAEMAHRLEYGYDLAAIALRKTDHQLKQGQLKALLWQQNYARLKLQYRQTRQLLALIGLVRMLLSERTAFLAKSPKRMRR